MDFTLDYASLTKKLEKQELESPSGIASPQVYGQLLAIYLLFHDLSSAKFLWKRIPSSIKNDNCELQSIWRVGKCLWKKNYPELYTIVEGHKSWPNHLKNIMNLILEQTRQRAIDLISKAYSSISYSNATHLLGLNEEDTLNLVRSLKWTIDEGSRFIEPRKPDWCDKSKKISGADGGTELIEKLTDYIVFLENLFENEK